MRSLFCRTQAILLLLLLLLVLPARAADSERDGNWWRGQTSADKATYLRGFLDGMDLGGVYSSQLPTTKDGQPDVSGMAAVDKAYKAQVKKYLNRVTVGQILDGLDKFYDDYRNRKILMSLGVSIVLDYISGKSEQEMTRLIETLRRLSQ